MNEENNTPETQDRPLGVLACVTTGFEVVARRPLLIMMPLLLDLFLWLGPRLSLAPIFEDANFALQEMARLTAASSPDVLENTGFLSAILDQLAEQFNLFSALNPGPLVGLPSLMASRMTLERPLGIRPDWVIASGAIAFLVLLLLAGIGIALNAIYLRYVGQSVIEETENPLPGPVGPLEIWWDLIQFTLVVVLSLFVASLPLSCLVTMLGPAFPVAAGFLLFLGSSFLLFIGFHLIFAIPGIVQVRRSPMQAIRESILITRADFVGSTGLLMLLLIIIEGLNFVWTLPEPATWATLVGLGGHAFISTAMVAALFVFYQERLNFLRILNPAYAGQPVHSPPDP